MAMGTPRHTAEERRVAVLDAAVTEFARSGYVGTSTAAIAARAGISQPYLFRLFGTKKDLFVATFELVGARIVAAMADASAGLRGPAAVEAMGDAYYELMSDPEMLEVQLHGFAAAPADPDIARSCRAVFERLAVLFAERGGLADDELKTFFAMGMLINVMSAIDLGSVAEPWAQGLCTKSGAGSTRPTVERGRPSRTSEGAP